MWIITLSRQEKAKLTVEVIQPRRYYKKDYPVQTAMEFRNNGNVGYGEAAW